MNILVTGASGFLGVHVARQLQDAGHCVATLDSRDADFAQHFKVNLADLDGLCGAVAGFDAVCHLAAIGDVYLAAEQPHLAASSNVTGTANLLSACVKSRLRRFIFASTWEVYGEPRFEPVDETHPCFPDHPYSITKLAGEQLSLATDRFQNLPVVALRLGTAYGLGMRANSVFLRFLDNAIHGRPIKINGTGHQARQFVHTTDIGRAFLAALEAPYRQSVFNVVGDEMISIRELADCVARRFPTEIQYEPERVGDIATARVSNALAKQKLGWFPKILFAEGLEQLMTAREKELAGN